jgi:ABC-type spermidine/putrescine transport system permease subunit I
MSSTGASEPLSSARAGQMDRPAWRVPVLRGEQGPVLVGLLPLLFLAFLFLLPVIRLLLLSVEGGTLAHFEKAVSGELYVQVFFETFKIATIVTAVSLLLAYPVAYFLATASPRWVLIGLVFLMLPFWTSILVRTYAWMILLGRNGVLNQILIALGFVSEPVTLLYNVTGVLIGMVHVLLPYMVFPIYSAMLRVDRDLMLAAEGLGASGWQVFWRVFLPLTMPGVMAGTALVFILSLGFYITPALLGGGRVIMIAVLIEQQVRQFLEWGFASALSILLLIATLLALLALNRMGWRRSA